jgi:quercetin dioxygenase-like cupin family protein
MADKARRGFRVADGDDRSGTPRGLGIGTLTFKVSTADSDGALMVCEIAHHAKGGPPRHIHHDQDEWFHVIKGKYVIEIGGERFSLGPGDSTFGPRGVPHGWAFVGDGPGRVTFVAVPASRLEPFFIEIAKANAMAPQDPAFWAPFNMTLFGPPLELP